MPKVKMEKTLADVVASGAVTFSGEPFSLCKRRDRDLIRTHALPLSAGLAPYKERKHTPAGPGLEPSDVGSWEDAPDRPRPPVGLCYQCGTVREAGARGGVWSSACAVCGSELALPGRTTPPPACGPKQRGAFGSWPGDGEQVTREPYRGLERRYHERRATA